MKITHDYFLTEWHRFREIMCSTAFEPQSKFDAYEGLLRVYFCCTDEDKENIKTRQTAMRMLQVEFPMRMGLEEVMRLETLFLEMSSADPVEIEIGSKEDNGGTNGN